MPQNIVHLKQNLAEMKRIARLMGAVRVHSLTARQEAVFYFVNPDADGPGFPLDSDQLHFEFPEEALLFLAVFPVKR
jgi:hypothetical protein